MSRNQRWQAGDLGTDPVLRYLLVVIHTGHWSVKSLSLVINQETSQKNPNYWLSWKLWWHSAPFLAVILVPASCLFSEAKQDGPLFSCVQQGVVKTLPPPPLHTHPSLPFGEPELQGLKDCWVCRGRRGWKEEDLESPGSAHLSPHTYMYKYIQSHVYKYLYIIYKYMYVYKCI